MSVYDPPCPPVARCLDCGCEIEYADFCDRCHDLQTLFASCPVEEEIEALIESQAQILALGLDCHMADYITVSRKLADLTEGCCAEARETAVAA